MGNTLGCYILCARPHDHSNKKCRANNKLGSGKRKWLRKRPKKHITVDETIESSESETTPQDTDETEDAEYKAFLENYFKVINNKRNTIDNPDPEIRCEVPPLYDDYMKISDFKRFVEHNFYALDKPKSSKQHQTYISDSIQCKVPDTVKGFLTTDWNTVVTNKEEEIRELVPIADDSGSKSESKPDHCEFANTYQSENLFSDDGKDRIELNQEQWFRSIESSTSRAKDFTISRFRMKYKNVNATFMSMPNLSEVRYIPDYKDQRMKETVFPESTDVNSYTLSRNNSTISSRTDESTTDSGRSSNASDSSTTRLKRVQSGDTRYICNPDCTLCHAAQIEYMVEVYEPLIARQIKVTDILEFLPLIEDKDKEMLRSKHCQSPQEAMEMLVKIIKKSDASGKWQSFLDAIQESEFTYMRMLLNGDTEIQYNYSTTVLTLIRPELKNRMCLPDFLDMVFEKELITEAEKDEAISLTRGTAAKTYILDRIDKHLPNWDNVLIEVLTDSYMSDLADLFVLVSQNETFNSDMSHTSKGRKHRNKLERTIRKHRLQVFERAHRHPVFESSESQVTDKYRLNGLEKQSVRNSTCVDQIPVVITDSSELKVNQAYLLQTLVSDQVELKRLQNDIFDQVKILKDDIMELKLCVDNSLLKFN